jgi:hypothetical protein
LSQEETARIVDLSRQADEVYLLSALRILLEQEHPLRHSSYPQVVLETVVLELSRLKSLVSVDEALLRADAGGKGPSAGNTVYYQSARSPAVFEAASPPVSGEAGPPPRFGEVGEPVLAVEEIAEPVGAEPAPEMARVKSHWREFLDKVYELNRGLHGVLSDTRPKSFEGGALVLSCKGPFHRDQLDKPENKKLIESLLEEATTLKVNVVPVLSGEGAAPRPAGPAAGAREARPAQAPQDEVLKPLEPAGGKSKAEMKELEKQEPFVAAVVKLFDGKVVDVKKTTRPGNGNLK